MTNDHATLRAHVQVCKHRCRHVFATARVLWMPWFWLDIMVHKGEGSRRHEIKKFVQNVKKTLVLRVLPLDTAVKALSKKKLSLMKARYLCKRHEGLVLKKRLGLVLASRSWRGVGGEARLNQFSSSWNAMPMSHCVRMCRFAIIGARTLHVCDKWALASRPVSQQLKWPMTTPHCVRMCRFANIGAGTFLLQQECCECLGFG